MGGLIWYIWVLIDIHPSICLYLGLCSLCILLFCAILFWGTLYFCCHFCPSLFVVIFPIFLVLLFFFLCYLLLFFSFLFVGTYGSRLWSSFWGTLLHVGWNVWFLVPFMLCIGLFCGADGMYGALLWGSFMGLFYGALFDRHLIFVGMLCFFFLWCYLYVSFLGPMVCIDLFNGAL